MARIKWCPKSKAQVSVGFVGVWLILAISGCASSNASLRPDLIARPATDLRLELSKGHRLLRLEVEFVNRGLGPLEIAPSKLKGRCAGGRVATQRVYIDSDGNGRYDRTKDRKHVDSDAGCLRFHPSHDHWHLLDMADYELLDKNEDVVGATSKVSACMEDVRRLHSGGPRELVYGDCDADSTQGLSVGWGDPYYADIVGQSIDITGLRDGDYCIVVKVDPKGKIDETDRGNNVSHAGVRITRTRVRPISC